MAKKYIAPEIRGEMKDALRREICTGVPSEVYKSNYDKIDWGSRARAQKENDSSQEGNA
jgi:DNA-directed RNA polymerase specialized sigma subunit